ncbi:unnamed protein product [marine sediment metagenome]|uniref:Uncharacterized protein n=1 Tax=marine sediment metagenome TaxID=412755 RepID=X1J7G2_9ZZZZ
MQKGKGFFRLVVAVSILVYFLVFFIVFINLESEYYEPKKPTKLTPKYSEILTEYNNLSEEERKQAIAGVGPKTRSLLIEYEELSDTERRELIIEFQSREKPSPFGKFIWQSMFTGVVSIIPIWIIYGLTIYVVRGFMGKEKRRENE